MKISEAIQELQEIQTTEGDADIFVIADGQINDDVKIYVDCNGCVIIEAEE